MWRRTSFRSGITWRIKLQDEVEFQQEVRKHIRWTQFWGKFCIISHYVTMTDRSSHLRKPKIMNTCSQKTKKKTEDFWVNPSKPLMHWTQTLKITKKLLWIKLINYKCSVRKRFRNGIQVISFQNNFNHSASAPFWSTFLTAHFFVSYFSFSMFSQHKSIRKFLLNSVELCPPYQKFRLADLNADYSQLCKSLQIISNLKFQYSIEF